MRLFNLAGRVIDLCLCFALLDLREPVSCVCSSSSHVFALAFLTCLHGFAFVSTFGLSDVSTCACRRCLL